MRSLFLSLMLASSAAMATNVPLPHPMQQQQQQVANGGSGGFGGSVTTDHNMYALPSWGGSYGSDLTVCGTGWGWGLWWGPDKDCIELVFKLRAIQTAPVPQHPVVIYTSPPAAPVTECPAPHKPKSKNKSKGQSKPKECKE